ncbi:hypothetical protein PBCVCVB1_420L [Paramecium bursaria Chlorella virus CVB-1]|nr:hypothetical protein PBCVCVB1_420L [Paramecium bursaria Chlorella virus CVB-1]
MSRIMPAMSDGRAFTNYVSSGLYNNYLEAQFKTPEDSQYRAYLQKNAKAVEEKIGRLTAVYIKPPVMPKSNLKVEGDPNARMTAAGPDYSQKILDDSYYKRVAQFNTVASQQKQYLLGIDNKNYSSM